ncbi:RNA pyrophosphohydrolase [Nevskia soli]|uniref:RNA pyrophosphohydrolase n=1 Tax=Nevskia soli TaxID=418856 RepID=UPI0004A7005A|nr:RNA pyrophosphohydrolase [Nevskia soli]
MIDADGFRPNVGIILANASAQVLWAKRIRQDAWQFPQGGIQRNETPEQALYRELEEELGLKPEHVSLLGVTNDWLRYRLPSRLIRRGRHPVCIGQKQKWFLLRMNCEECLVHFNATSHPEFDGWRWVDFWQPVQEVVAFKRGVYQEALNQLAPLLGLPPREAAAQNVPAQTSGS